MLHFRLRAGRREPQTVVGVKILIIPRMVIILVHRRRDATDDIADIDDTGVAEPFYDNLTDLPREIDQSAEAFAVSIVQFSRGRKPLIPSVSLVFLYMRH